MRDGGAGQDGGAGRDGDAGRNRAWDDSWAAPIAVRAVDATVEVPGSKSGTNRALVLAALAAGTSRLSRPLRSRDTELMAAALRALGARVRADGTDWLVDGVPGPLTGGVAVDLGNAGTVARFLPPVATLAAGPVHFDGDPRMRERPVGELLGALRAAGAHVDDATPDSWSVRPGPLAAGTVAVEPDLSSAAPFLAAAAVTAGRVRVQGWPAVTTQAGDRLPELLERMGCSVRRDSTDGGGGELELTGSDRLAGLTADLHDVGELTPVVAAVCAVAAGPSRLTGVAHLRRHETDRLAALATEINRLGGDVRELPDGLEIRPRRLSGGLFRTYDDHRLAMAAAVLGLVVPGVRVQNPGTTAKTFPGFVPAWSRMLGLGQLLAGVPA